MYLGIDVGGTKIQGVYLQQGAVQLTARRTTPTSDYEAFLETLVGIAEEAVRDTGRLKRMGIGIPGTTAGGNVIWVPNLPYLDGRALAQDLGARLRAEVVLANDAQLALLGEQWQGAARGRLSAVLLTIGTGVGGAIMVDGKIVRGVHGSAGAFGWLNLDWRESPDQVHGYLGRHGSGRTLSELGQQLDPPVSSYELIARARAGDPASREIIEQFSRLLGVACASLASILDPEVLIVAGGLADAFDLLAEALRSGLREAGSPSVRQTPLVVAHLGKDAAAYGALRAALDEPSLWSEG
jgi:predicted NBD/HSP70 family sugar kinase